MSLKKGKVWDITPAKNSAERYYAKMEHKRIVWHDLWQPTTYIEVKDAPTYSPTVRQAIIVIESFKV